MSDCPHCNSPRTYGMARIVGYYSIIHNWNKSKQQERKDRVQSHFSETDTKGIGFVRIWGEHSWGDL